MSHISITWSGLQDDREKEIYLDGFWEGVKAGGVIEEAVRKLEKEWKDGKNNDLQKAVQQTSGEGEES